MNNKDNIEKNIENNIEKNFDNNINDNIKKIKSNKINYKYATSLYDRLVAYSKSDIYPFHMPGHKRNSAILQFENPYNIDITEIDNFDNLHNANDIILNLMQKISSYYKSKKSYVLVNGSSCGILTAISVATIHNKNILVARNCHKSVYNAVLLNKLNATYIFPNYDKNNEMYGSVDSSEVERVLSKAKEDDREIGTIVLTSPTYEGIVSNIEEISSIARKYNCTLIVDEAHGAHFSGSDYFPKSAVECGADIVIHSVHKTLPSMTQTALLHVCSDRVDISSVEKYLAIYESSSPSYVLMSSVDRCFSLLEERGKDLFEIYKRRLNDFLDSAGKLSNIGIYSNIYSDTHTDTHSDINRNMHSSQYFDEYDKGKLVIYGKQTRISGKKLYDILLNKYGLQMEMASNYYVIAMTSICDTEEGFERLFNALEEIDNNKEMLENLCVNKYNYRDNSEDKSMNIACDKKFEIFETEVLKKVIINIGEAIGKVAGEAIYLYPPGSPLIVAGEIFNETVINKIVSSKEEGLNVLGTDGKTVIIVE